MRTKRIALVATALAAIALVPACGGDKGSAPTEDLAAAEARGVALLERYDPADLEKACQILGDVVKRAPQWRDARVNHAIALAARKQAAESAEALAECRKVLDEDPWEPHALFVAALVERFSGHVDEAVPYLERLLEVDPDEPSVWYWLGTVEMEGAREDLARAEQYLRQALQLAPADLSATYGLFQVLARRGKGDTDEAKALLATFHGADEAKDFGSGALAKHSKRGDKEYGEAGTYARAIHDVTPPSGAVFAEATAPTGFGKPVEKATGIACGDLDGDGDDDLLVVASEGPCVVYRNDRGQFVDVTATCGLPPTLGGLGALFADLDDDGRLDLVVAGPGVLLYRNKGGLTFEEFRNPLIGIGGFTNGNVTVKAVTCADVDHDGDVDVIAAGGVTSFLRNRRDGSFDSEAAAEKGVKADGSTGVLAFDADGDTVTDLVFFGRGGGAGEGKAVPPRLLLNGRLGPFIADSRLDALGPAVSGTVGDLDGDGNLDLLLVRPDGSLALARGNGRGTFALDPAFPSLRLDAAFCAIADVDSDGQPDALAVGKRVTLLRGQGNNRYRVEGVHLPAVERSAMAITDVDGDGDLDVVLVEPGHAPRLLKNGAPASNHVVRLRLRGVPDRVEGRTWSNVKGIGAEVEVKAGDLIARRLVTCGAGFPGQATTDVFVGIGARTHADFTLVHWTDGVMQNESDLPLGAVKELVEVNRKLASCPLVFAWDGKAFQYVTDCLGVGGLGFYSGPPVGYAPPDPTEVVLLPPLAARNGHYEVSLVENLEEASYLDEARMLVVDHPVGMEIHPDERFAVEEPMPADRLYGVTEKIFPVAATDDRGQDVRAALLAEDRVTVDTFARDRRFIGMANEHSLVLDFGDALPRLGAEERLVLFLAGWIEYGYSKTYVGTEQAGIAAMPPVLEVPDGAGGWKKAAAIGYPAGNSRTMTFDVTKILGPGATRCRIRSNMEVYWDQVFVARDRSVGALRVTTLPVAGAELSVRGYPREYSPDGRAPTLYDYAACESWIPFRSMAGDYTRLGDVTPLVTKTDDQFAIFGKGEEVVLRFDASKIAPVKAGEARTFLLRLDGYCKDRDPYTARGDTVEPLPFHAMSNYPYGDKERYPDDAAHREYRARWNTRKSR